MHASQVAMRSSAAAKRNALRNAMINAGLSATPGSVQQQMFLTWIDELTEWHIRVLAFLGEPRKRLDERKMSATSLQKRTPEGLIELYFGDELTHDPEFARQLHRDLENRGLVREAYATKLPHALALDRRTSKMGAAFLTFISQP